MTGWFPANLLELFSVLHAGQLDLHLNFGDINFFWPKVNKEKMIQQYMPIHLLSVSFKIFYARKKHLGWVGNPTFFLIKCVLLLKRFKPLYWPLYG
jgi:hypothetical protein